MPPGSGHFYSSILSYASLNKSLKEGQCDFFPFHNEYLAVQLGQNKLDRHSLGFKNISKGFISTLVAVDMFEVKIFFLKNMQVL